MKNKKKIRPNSTADWQEVKKDYLKGLSQDELCEKHSINKNTLNVHITAEGWTAEKELVMAESNRKLIMQTANKRTEEILKLKIDERKSALKALDRVNDFLEQELKPYELKLLTDCQQKIQQVLYKSYGIDSVNLNINNPAFDTESKERLIEAQDNIQNNTDKILEILVNAGAFGNKSACDAAIDEVPPVNIPTDAPAQHTEPQDSIELVDDPHLVPSFLRKRKITA